jgi:hypothetical protein
MNLHIRLKSSLGYGAAMAASVTYFLAQVQNLAEKPIIWIACIGSSLAAIVVGWLFGKWYEPVLGERPAFELVVFPVLVLALSVLAGLIAVWAWALIVEPSQPQPFMALAVLLYFGFAAFLGTAWLAIGSTFSAVGIWLAISSRSAPNNSFKPRPLRGSA